MVVALEGMLGRAPGIVQGHAARHAEMDDQRLAVVEAHQHVFRAPVDCGDGAAFDLRRELRRQLDPQVLAPLDQAGDAMADHARDEAAADGFDLRQLGHGLLV